MGNICQSKNSEKKSKKCKKLKQLQLNISELPQQQMSQKTTAETDAQGLNAQMKNQFIQKQQTIEIQKGGLILKGPHGNVYECLNLETGQLLIDKIVDNSQNQITEEQIQFFQDNLLELNDVNLVQYYDCHNNSTPSDTIELISGYVSGGSIRNLLEIYGSFTEKVVQIFSQQILTGLKTLHEKEIFHQNLKSSNVLVEANGQLKLSDF